jgi:ornithine cyclodeaminase
VAVDNLPGVQQLSREFMTQYETAGWDRVSTLAQLIAAGRRRTAHDDITVFKAMGMGISDLALGVELVRRARAGGIGRSMPQPKKAKPRLARKSAKNAA